MSNINEKYCDICGQIIEDESANCLYCNARQNQNISNNRRAESFLGIAGGLLAIISGFLILFIGLTMDVIGTLTFSNTSSAESVGSIGLWSIIVGILGIVGSTYVQKNNKRAGYLMFFSGLSGFIYKPGLFLIFALFGAYMNKDNESAGKILFALSSVFFIGSVLTHGLIFLWVPGYLLVAGGVLALRDQL